MNYTCPVHGTGAIRTKQTNKGLNVWCARKIGNVPGANENGFCSAKPVLLDAPPAPVPSPAPSAPAANYGGQAQAVPFFDERDSGTSRQDQLRIAALEFAGRLYAGAVPIVAEGVALAGQVEQQAMVLADRVYLWLEGQ